MKKLNLLLKHGNSGHVTGWSCVEYSVWGQSRSVVWGQLLLFLTFSYKGNINCIIQPINSWIKITCKITFIGTSAPTLRQTLSRHNNSNIFKGTAKKTKTNSLWIVLTYAMWNSLPVILYHWYLIPYSVSISIFVIPFPFPDSGFRVLVPPLFIYLAPN